MITELRNQHELDDFTLYLLENLLKRTHGERCDTYDEGCVVCEGWKFFDDLSDTVKEMHKCNI